MVDKLPTTKVLSRILARAKPAFEPLWNLSGELSLYSLWNSTRYRSPPCAHSLPPEIYDYIFSWCSDRKDLRNVCLACRNFRDIAQPLLFRHLFIRPYHWKRLSYPIVTYKRDLRATYSLLKNQPKVAQRCVSVTLHALHPEGSSWLDFEALAMLVNVKKLSMLGPLFITKAGSPELHRKFEDVITHRWLDLESIVFDLRPPCSDPPTYQGLAVPQFSIPNIRLALSQGGWDNGIGFRRFIPTLRASSDNVHSVLLSFLWDWPSTLIGTVYALRLPNLQVLYLGNGFDRLGGAQLTSFLVAHPKLYELSLVHRVTNSSITCLSEKQLSAKSLPRLRVLQASMIDVALLVQLQLESLATSLEDLSIDNEGYVGPICSNYLSKALLAGFPGFLRLSTLRLRASVWFSSDLERLATAAQPLIPSLKLLGQFCPSVAYLEMSTNFHGCEGFWSIFTGYSQLTRLTLSSFRPSSSFTGSVLLLFQTSQSLLEVRSGSTSFRIKRSFGGIIQFTICENPGQYTYLDIPRHIPARICYEESS